MKKQSLYLIDTNNLMYQFWYKTSKQEINEKGECINVINALKRFTHQLIHNEKAECMVFVFDQRLKKSKRKQLLPQYKAQRSTTPEALVKQFIWCKDWVKQQGIAQISSDRVEADDVIATLMQRYRAEFEKITIISSDKDLYQLIEDEDECWDLLKDKRIKRKEIIKITGVEPQQIADQLALVGDKSDNIPGIPGVGLHTAAKLLKKFGTLENIIEQKETIKNMKFRNAYYVQQQINTHFERLNINKQLTRLDKNVPDLELLRLCRH